MSKLREFVRESNRIEGITRDPEPYELEAHQRLIACDYLTLKSVEDFVFDICGKRLRREPGMNVRVGPHVPPPGGPEIPNALDYILTRINQRSLNPYEAHVYYETLHPFMDGNGRSGRAIWNWQMQRERHDPYALPFLHRFYYQALDAAEVRS
ncbi:MAG TPA: Fic family protein [Solirubrobacterales bacterium]|nr:Fic family protein [Solirubrobacterales bacterium]